MRKASRALLPAAIVLGFMSWAGAPPAPPQASDAAAAEPEWQADPPWPRVVEQGNLTVTIYQPQLDRFEDDLLEGRAAVSVKTKAADKSSKDQTTYGVIWIKARTQIDKDAGLVHLDEIEIPKANFPGQPDKTDEYLALIRSQVEPQRTVSLARIEANLAITQADKKGAAVPLKNDPPRIFYSTVPAILVLVDGDAVVRPVEGQSLRRVVNTRALILTDGSRFFMPIMDRWLQAGALDGAWSYGNPPPGAQAIRDAIANDESQAQTDLMDEPSDDVKALVQQGSVPKILVSTAPAELIQTNGDPDLKPVEGTGLLYVTNTAGDIFLELRSQNYYVPLSGRWYRSKSLDGPWAFVEGDKLPADFQKIPTNEPKAEVLATVPGTPEAQEAVIANSIPQTAEVNREDAKLQTQYDGDPQFQPVPDTPLQYAVNSPTPVIRVDASDYYAVQDGIWFFGGSPVGPWVVATAVPPVIYTIPTACPIHYVTYVRVYRYTPTVVYVGYTPGYLGMCYSPWGTVVYGTGWYYQPWIGSVWLGYPWTWGFGVHIGWSPWYGVRVGWGWGGYRPWRPWWGPYGYGWGRPRPAVPYWGTHPGRPRTINHLNVYNGRPGVVRPVARPPGRPLPGGPVAARPAPARPNPRPGSPAAPGARPAPQPESPQARPAPRPGPQNRPATRPDVYAGKDGSVYRPAPNGSWQQYNGKDWKSMPGESGGGSRPAREARPAGPQTRPVESPSSLSRERQARQMGEARVNPPAPRAAPPRPAPAPKPR